MSSSGFVNLNRVRQQAKAKADAEAAAAALAAAAAAGPPSTLPGSSNASPSSPPASPSSASSSGGARLGSNGLAVSSSGAGLVRRHHTVGGKLRRELSATQRERVGEDVEGEEEGEEMGESLVARARAVAEDAVESPVDQGSRGLSKLTRQSSLPSRSAPIVASPIATHFSRHPSMRTGPARSSTLDPNGEDEAWDRSRAPLSPSALYYPSGSLSPLHQTVFESYPLSASSSHSSGGSKAGSHPSHQRSMSNSADSTPSLDFLAHPPSSAALSSPFSPVSQRADAPGVRRHQSLHGVSSSSSRHSRFPTSPTAYGLSRSPSPSSSERGIRTRSTTELLPPVSPNQRSVWDAPESSELRDRWDEEQAIERGPMSPVVPGTGSRMGSLRRKVAEDGQDAAAMSAEQLQAAFDAMTLARQNGAPTITTLSPPPFPSSGTGPNSSDEPTARRTHSRSPSLNPPGGPPRFASPQPGQLPSTSSNSSTNIAPQPGFHQNRPLLSPPSAVSTASRKLSLITDFAASRAAGPASAAAYVPPVGHSTLPPLSRPTPLEPGFGAGTKPFTAMGTGWEQKDAILGPRPGSFAPLVFSGSPGNFGRAPMLQGYEGQPSLPPILSVQQQAAVQAQFLAAQQQAAFGFAPQPPNGLMGGGGGPNHLQGLGGMPIAAPMMGLASPVDATALAQAKGYNPAVFDTNPARARFFVIKSYTEDDVAKSLKHEIWSSTTFGNKRLDKAFKESGAEMPIYLFFSVNSSGHFCGMAQMLTDVDYTTTSTVWAQDDKWKGLFKLRFIYVKDVPNQALRHIRLNNTAERKPVTNSRDTQELAHEAGVEVLRIMRSYQSRTSLLQDYAFYDLQSLQKDLASSVTAPGSAQLQPTNFQGVPPPQRPHQGMPGSPYASSAVYGGGGAPYR